MIDAHDLDRPDPALLGLYTGFVAANNDPEGVGRVRVIIPGLIESPGSAWAFPLATGGGGNADRGDFVVPSVDSEVGIFFKQGDPDHPYYLSGAWGRGETPGVAKGLRTDADKVRVIETEGFRITIDSRPASRQLLLEDKHSGDKILMNGRTREIQVKSTTKLTLEATGMVDIKGAVVQINGVPAGSGQL